MNQYIPAIITSSVALMATIFSQFLFHYLSTIRERRNRELEAYQQLFSPILHDVYSFFEAKNAFRPYDLKDDVDAEQTFNRIYSHIEDNLKYADSQLIDAYESHRTINLFFENLRGLEDIEKAKLCQSILHGALIIVQKNRVLNKYNYNKMIEYKFYYTLWSLILEITHDEEKTQTVLSMKFYFNKKRLNMITFNLLLIISRLNVRGEKKRKLTNRLIRVISTTKDERELKSLLI